MTSDEALLSYLASFTESLAQCAEAVQAQADAQESIVVKLDQLESVVAELAGKTGQLYDAASELNERLGKYLTDQAKHQSGVRDVDQRLRKLEQARGGG